MKIINTLISIEVIDDYEEILKVQSPMKKPFLRLKFSDDTIQDITCNIGEMIGGAARGVIARYNLK